MFSDNVVIFSMVLCLTWMIWWSTCKL